MRIFPTYTLLIVSITPQPCFFIVVHLASPMRWMEMTYSRGLAVASGCFIFDVVKILADGSLIVIAGQQRRSCSLSLGHAIARPKRRAWQLCWEGLPEAFASAPRSPSPTALNDYYRQTPMRSMAQTLEP